MDDPSKTPQSAASEQSHPRSLNHPRPFFYVQPPVQPPVQPFYTYQWHMNSPFGHHHMPASGFHLGRPYMVPYSYLQYPGYVVSQAAMHPVDCRRIYERNLPHAATATGYDITLRHQHCNAQRETTCAGAQTDPCDALNKLIECLDQLRAGEGTSQRELDSGVVSQTSGVFSPVAEVQKGEDKVLCDSTLACYNVEATGHVEDFNHQEDWSLDLGKEPPLDSSSVHEEGGVFQEGDKYLQQECRERHSSQSLSVSPISSSQRNCLDESSHEVLQTNEEVQWNCYNGTQPSSQSSPAHPSSRTTEGQDPEKVQKPPVDAAGDHSCCILRLPFEKVISTGIYVPSAASSLGSPFSYSYCPPQMANERVSVLSLSLDELSSHDEVLSTDMDDMDLFPTHMYTKGKHAMVASKKSHSLAGDFHCDMRPLYPKKLTCAICGSNAFRELSKPKVHHGEAHCYEDVDYSDEEAIVAKSGDTEFGKPCRHCHRGTVTKMHMPKRSHPFVKHRVRLTQRREKVQDETKTSQLEASCSDHFCCENCMSSPEKHSAHAVKERLCRTVGITSDQILRESVPRPKGCKSQSLQQRQERQRQRKTCFQPQECRSGNLDYEEDDEGQEMLHLNKERNHKMRRC